LKQEYHTQDSTIFRWKHKKENYVTIAKKINPKEEQTAAG
jgi:hypothetical protein